MKKGILKIGLANALCMVLSLITNFLLPKYLPVESYAMIKTYALYIGYAGFFALGYTDSVYLRYGGKPFEEIHDNDIKRSLMNYIYMTFIEAVVIVVVAVAFENHILVAFALGMITNNVLGYYKMLFQATGEFSLYSKALNIEKILVFLLIIILLFVFKTEAYMMFVWAQVFSGILVMLYFSAKIRKQVGAINEFRFRINEIVSNIKDGFVLMLGNFSSGIFSGLDRWFVKFLLPVSSFAMYSFAASTESIVSVFTSPITISMYNWFCKKPEIKRIKLIKRLVMIWGLIIATASYPARLIIKYYLANYLKSSEIVVFLIGAQTFYVVVKGIYVNIYKSNKQQSRYFAQLLAMIGVAFGLNTVFFLISRDMKGISLATYCTAIIWLIVCELEEKELRFAVRDWIFISLNVITYLSTAISLQPVLGCIIYMVILFLTILILERECFIFCLDNLQKFFVSRGNDNY